MSQNTTRFKVLADGTQVPETDPRTDHVAILDTARNLLIHPHSIGVKGKRARQSALKKEIAKLDALGGNWRLAERDEAESILDLSRYNPAVNPSLYPGIKPEGHVTATPAAWAPARAAWWVYFSSGSVYVNDLDYYFGWGLAARSAGQ